MKKLCFGTLLNLFIRQRGKALHTEAYAKLFLRHMAVKAWPS